MYKPVTAMALPEYHLWKKIEKKRTLLSFDLEITARCNNRCRHCYINLPPEDPIAKNNELKLEELKDIIDEAVSLGALWCLVSGGEPLLREDFVDIYLYLKKKGLLVSVFTNATLLTAAHAKLFKQYPPRGLEVSIYGVTKETYERVTRTQGSFAAFRRGLSHLFNNQVKVRLKAMALRSNLHEMVNIAQFCRENSRDHFRFDPFLHLRFDLNQIRNREIMAERLSPQQVVKLEQKDPVRFEALKKTCNEPSYPEPAQAPNNHLFRCGAGNGSFTLGYNGLLRLCSGLCHPDCVYDLKSGNLGDAWSNFIPRIVDIRSDREDFKLRCRDCALINLCMWCPAHAHLETGVMDQPVDYFCQLAHARAAALKK